MKAKDYLRHHRILCWLLIVLSAFVGGIGSFLILFAAVGIGVATSTGDWNSYIGAIVVIMGLGLICCIGGVLSAVRLRGLQDMDLR
jgi:purine-cytosine permease-like protein